MKTRNIVITIALLIVGGAAWHFGDKSTPAERMLAHGSPVAKGSIGSTKQDWQFVPRGVLTSSSVSADPKIATLTERLRQKGMGRIAPPAMQTPVVPKESLIPKQPTLSELQQKELNAIYNGPYKDVTYLGNSDNATVKMLASPDLAWLPPGEQLGAEAKSRRFFTNNKALLRIGTPDQELQLAKSETMTDGTQVLRFQQTFGGLEVWPAQVVTNVAKDGRLTAMTGAYVPTPEGLVLSATVAPGEAVRVAWAHIGLLPPTARPAPVLKIYAEKGAAKELAYEVMVEGGMRDSQVFVSANSGKVLKSISRICTGAVPGSGVGLGQFQQTLPQLVHSLGGLVALPQDQSQIIGSALFLPTKLGLQQHGVEWISQFVGNVGGECRLGLSLVLQLIQHDVERCPHRLQLVHLGLGVQSEVQVAIGDFPGTIANVGHRSQG